MLPGMELAPEEITNGDEPTPEGVEGDDEAELGGGSRRDGSIR